MSEHDWAACPRCGGNYTSYPPGCRALCGLCIKGRVPARLVALLSEGQWIRKEGVEFYLWYDGLVKIYSHAQDGDVVISGDCDEDELPALISRLQEIQAGMPVERRREVGE